MSTESFNQWCLVELFGHQQLVGLVTEASIGGVAFIRVDVPEHGKQKTYTRYLGNGAIYSITPMEENAARVLMSGMDQQPPFVWMLNPHRAQMSLEDASGDSIPRSDIDDSPF